MRQVCSSILYTIFTKDGNASACSLPLHAPRECEDLKPAFCANPIFVGLFTALEIASDIHCSASARSLKERGRE